VSDFPRAGTDGMRREFLGDSYDAVKRLWQQVLAPWAPLYAVPSFIPADLQEAFTRLTGIPIAVEAPRVSHSLLNDPDTGIRLPRGKHQDGNRHVTLDTIVCQFHQSTHLQCVITFDQSHYRGQGLLKDQRLEKLQYLNAHDLHAFYYASHASFLFAVRSSDALHTVGRLLLDAGIPETKLEPLPSGAAAT
jgi:hypothetical protein